MDSFHNFFESQQSEGNLQLSHSLPDLLFAAGIFDIECFDPLIFNRFQISPPPSIQRSVRKRQAEFLAGRICARRALSELCENSTAPCMQSDGSPQWPWGITGSITHCISTSQNEGWAAAVVANKNRWRSLGLDAENLLEPAEAQAILNDVLTPFERNFCVGESIAWQVTLTFSLKESLFKALYPLVKRRFYFEDAELISWQNDGTARLRLLSDLSPEWRANSEIEGHFYREENRVVSVIAIPAH